MYICHCNFCGGNFEDPNPSSQSKDYPDTTPISGKLQTFYEEVENLETGYWGCPTCCTDGGLIDNMPIPGKEQIFEGDTIRHEQTGEIATANSEWNGETSEDWTKITTP